MTRFVTRASLIALGSAAILATAATGSAWSQARIYPEGTDCAAMKSAVDRLECTQQLGNEQQNGSTLFNDHITMGVARPSQQLFNNDLGGGGTQAPVVPSNGVSAPPDLNNGANNFLPQ
jgi:hypothetical protein